MGFAANFKKTLNSTDIFTPQCIKVHNKGNVTSPISFSNIPEISQDRVENKLNSLINSTVKKIKNTPYWSEYSEEDQERMISQYFDNKIRSEKYADVKVTVKEKLDFLDDVLARVKKL